MNRHPSAPSQPLHGQPGALHQLLYIQYLRPGTRKKPARLRRDPIHAVPGGCGAILAHSAPERRHDSSQGLGVLALVLAGADRQFLEDLVRRHSLDVSVKQSPIGTPLPRVVGYLASRPELVDRLQQHAAQRLSTADHTRGKVGRQPLAQRVILEMRRVVQVREGISDLPGEFLFGPRKVAHGVNGRLLANSWRHGHPGT